MSRALMIAATSLLFLWVVAVASNTPHRIWLMLAATLCYVLAFVALEYGK